MTVGYYPDEEYFEPAEWAYEYEYVEVQDTSGARMSGLRVDGITVAALILLLFMAFRVVADRIGNSSTVSETSAPSVPQPETKTAGDEQPAPPPVLPQTIDPATIVYPYDDYVLTQGPHGYSYGHMAIDLAAGKGTPIKSPIAGKITALYVDEWGNPTIVIENSRYQVTMLHGDYTVQVGQQIELGQVVGTESNHGYTLDMAGNSCHNRDCGHHTHLNIFDKQAGANVNPLSVLK